MKRSSARSKGKSGEKEICKILNDHFSLDAERNYNQACGGSDVYELGMAIEVKRHEVLNINKWWDQVLTASRRTGRIPVLAYRSNRKPWSFCLSGNNIGLDYSCRITLDQDTWIKWIELHYQYLTDLENSFR